MSKVSKETLCECVNAVLDGSKVSYLNSLLNCSPLNVTLQDHLYFLIVLVVFLFWLKPIFRFICKFLVMLVSIIYLLLGKAA